MLLRFDGCMLLIIIVIIIKWCRQWASCELLWHLYGCSLLNIWWLAHKIYSIKVYLKWFLKSYLAMSGLSCSMWVFSCGAPASELARRVSSCSVWAWFPHGMWRLSSLTSGWTHIPCIGRWILNHWATKEVLDLFLIEKYPLILAFISLFIEK